MNLITVSGANDVQVSAGAEGEQRKTELLSSAELVVAVTSEAGEKFALKVLSEIRGHLKTVEYARKAVKEPFRLMAEKVDTIAKAHADGLVDEVNRIQHLLSDWEAVQLAKRREAERLINEERERIRKEQEKLQRETEERQRQAGLERRKEMEAAAAKARAEAEARLKEAEAKRQEEIRAASDKSAAERARVEAMAIVERQKQMEAEQRRFRDEEQRFQAKQEAQRRSEEAEATKAQQALARQEAAVMADVPAIGRTAGKVVRQPWEFEVIDADEVYKTHPEWCTLEVRASAVKEAIKQGVRECPGLRIYQTVKATARAA